MARAPVSKTGGWGFEVPPLLPIRGRESGPSYQIIGDLGLPDP